jgi:very-short-patch-repair endonuclease
MGKAVTAKDFANNPTISAQIKKQSNTSVNRTIKKKSIKSQIQDANEELRKFAFENALQKYGISPQWRYEKKPKSHELEKKEIMFARQAFGRGWRCDYYFEANGIKVAVEQEGATMSNGRHTRGKGYEEDMKKYNAYTALGISLLRFTTTEMSNFPLQIAEIVKKALNKEDYSVNLKKLYKFN